jgi:hypothetical protein
VNGEWSIVAACCAVFTYKSLSSAISHHPFPHRPFVQFSSNQP